MVSMEKFNNKLIKNIVKTPCVAKLFYSFLTESAQDEVNYSRIQDKESHYEAIALYAKLISENTNDEDNLNSSSS